MNELPPGWVATELADVTAPASDARRASEDERYLGLENVEGETTRVLGTTPATGLRSPAKPFAPGDVLYARLRPYLNKVCAPDFDGLASSEFLVFKPRPWLEPRFLMYALNTAAFVSFANSLNQGVGRPRVRWDQIAGYRFALPPLAEQRRIVASIEEQLSRLDAAVSALHFASLRLDAAARSVLAFAVSEGEEHPLGQLLDGIEAGRSFGDPGPPAGANEWGVIRVSAMTWGEFRAEENKRAPVENVDPRWEIHPGDLLVSRANTTALVGAAVLVGEVRPRLLLSDKSLRLLVKPEINKQWLVRALSAPQSRRQISAVASGTSDSMRNVSQEKLRAVKLRVPTPERQAALAASVANELDRLAGLRNALAGVGAKADVLRQAVLASAFRGELVSQDPDDEPATTLLERIAVERATAGPARTRREMMST